MDFDEASRAMAQPVWCEAWRAEFACSDGWAEDPSLDVPHGEALARRCRELGFPEAAIPDITNGRDTLDDPRVRRLAAHVQWLATERYTPREWLMLGWPPGPPGCPLFYAYAAIGAATRVEARHRALGIAQEVTRATLWDVGQQVVLHRRIHGEPGMAKGFWIAHHLASHLFRLGRLQHQRSFLHDARGPMAAGEPVLDLHIPEDGRLSPEACDASLAAGRRFFADHFPEHRARFFTCYSWLLDPQLADLLPEESHIVQFQRRFERTWEGPAASGSVFEFVFDRPDLDAEDAPDVSQLPARTRVERAIVDHYASGGRIHATFGWIAIDEAAGTG